MLAEWQNEYGSDHLILMKGWGGGAGGGGREDVFGSGVVSSATDLVFLFASYTKCTIAFTPVFDIFSWQNRILDFFFSKNLHAHPNKNQMVAL